MALRVAGHLLVHLLLLLAFSAVLAASEDSPDIKGDQDATIQADTPELEKPASDVDLTPTSIGTYIAELFGTLAGLAWGLYASLPSFG